MWWRRSRFLILRSLASSLLRFLSPTQPAHHDKSATEQQHACRLGGGCRGGRSAAEGEVVDGEALRIGGSFNFEAADVRGRALNAYKVTGGPGAHFQVRVGNVAEGEVGIEGDDRDIAERGIQPETDFRYLGGEEDLDQASAVESGVEIEVHRSENRGRGVGVAGDTIGELIQSRFIGADDSAHRKLNAGDLVKNERIRIHRVTRIVVSNRLGRTPGDIFEVYDRGSGLKSCDRCRVRRIHYGCV